MGETTALPTIDDFETDFDGALTDLTAKVIAQVESDTKGMSEIEVAQYWVDASKDNLATLERLDAPDCIMERARSVLMRRETALAALREPE
jgi:hypothetical protein